ncbi:ribosomal-protein-alanine N-acetyltransferase [Terribacillus aidingensis]|uniref:Ribosomal-protein-alanine N-acetyltransferase n=1 Tax=Terribacillus aidingensis TaxID=586416 RepID=A0A285P6Z4_9BACI|nr:GNAT family protein [Terribacillus aidingensis]SNZ17519.1 ribosomal-protein-alanine N-acetyltransferase [Terribacillus aidingensis]
MPIEHILENLPTLETERLRLRKVTAADADAIFAYGSDSAVSEFVTWNTHQSIDDTQQFLDIILSLYENHQAVFWGIEHKEQKQLIGTINYVSWNQKDHVGEIGYVMARPYWGNGYMAEAAKEVITFGFERMKLERIQAKCIAENEGSEKVMQKSGMLFEGTLRKLLCLKGKQRDVKMYAITKSDFLHQKKPG